MRVISIVGARPQFVKAAPLSKALRYEHEEYLVHTGQHYDPEMSDIFFEELGIPKPDLNLGIGALSNLEQVSHMMLALRPVMETRQPDWIIVYGDTNSTLAGALVGKFLNIRVVHIEAGLRSYNREMPEETNRILTDHISSLLFCPTAPAAANLKREGIVDGVYVVGDVMIDALLQNRQKTSRRILEQYALHPGKYFLATIHRPSNTDNVENLSSILAAFKDLKDVSIVVPTHPRLRKSLQKHNLLVSENVQLIPPVGYLDMLSLSAAAQVILTDSGGLQKEAYALEVPCVTMREETEWVETVEAGWNRLTGPDRQRIVKAVHETLNAIRPPHPNFYGTGNASINIVNILTAQE